MRVVALALAAVAMLFSVAALAHQQKEAISTISYNARSERLEIVHRFYVHDAEHAVKRILGKQADLIQNPETKIQFARYVQDKFSLRLKSDEVLDLTYVGAEVEGKFLWVYQEAAKPLNAIAGVKVQFFYEIWASHVNVVDLQHESGNKSMRLVKHNDWHRLPK